MRSPDPSVEEAVRPPPRPGFRRTSCRCGCGVWFYDTREGARHPRWYASPEHYLREKNRRRRERSVSARRPGAESA